MEKEEVFQYSDQEFLVYLEDHINYLKSYASRLEGCLSVYHEIKEEYKEIGFGWEADSDIIENINRMKQHLDQVFFAVLRHQKGIIGSLKFNEHIVEKMKNKIKEEQKDGDVSII